MRHAIRILVVDDDASDRHQLADALQGVGYHTAECATCADAVRLAPTFLPDLLLLEMVQGEGVVGPDLARRLQSLREHLVMFVSRDGRVNNRLAAFDAGADDYVVKPYVMAELLARVRALLRRSGRVASRVSQVGRLIVDEPAHRVTFGGVAVDLPPIDFGLLAELSRHAGRVLSKAHLLELVWGYDAMNENLVEVHISNLRRRLGQPAAALVQTVRGVGYVLRAEHLTPA